MLQYCREYDDNKWVECGRPADVVIYCQGHGLGEKLDSGGIPIKRKGVEGG